MFRIASNHISYFGAFIPYLFMKQVYQIGNMEGFFLWRIMHVRRYIGAVRILEYVVVWDLFPYRINQQTFIVAELRKVCTISLEYYPVHVVV